MVRLLMNLISIFPGLGALENVVLVSLELIREALLMLNFARLSVKVCCVLLR